MMLAAGLLNGARRFETKLTGLVAGHCGSLADGEAAVRPLKAFGPPVMDAMGPISNCAPQRRVRRRGCRSGALNYWKSQFLTDLSDDCYLRRCWN